MFVSRIKFNGWDKNTIYQGERAIDDMNNQGIHLVVPESLKKLKGTCYNGKINLITFREFFDDEISSKRPGCRKT